MDLLQKFKEFVRVKKLLQSDTPVLIAVSGGLDSVVLAHLFKQAGFAFGIAHCNFQLRAEESGQDESFVRQLATELDARIFVKHFNTTDYAQAQSLSIQVAARNLRYEWFGELCREQGFAAIATAHHLNDSIETALFNFVRGTGLPGLSGIAAVTGPDQWDVALIRPLLFATRPEIEAYATGHHLSWREDSSNASDKYSRNYIRHHIMPLLETLNPNFLHTAERNLRRFSETEANINFLIDKYLGDNLSEINLGALKRLPAPQQALHQILNPKGFSYEQARQVADHLDQSGFELESDTGWRLLVDRVKLFLSPPGTTAGPAGVIRIEKDDLMVTLPNGARLVMVSAAPDAPFPDGHNSIVTDAGKLHFPLLLRPWLPGDTFQPFGMGGRHQKLQDFFTNLKLSRLDKEEIWVLENADGRIIWVIGYRPDERFRIEPGTQKAIKISLVK